MLRAIILCASAAAMSTPSNKSIKPTKAVRSEAWFGVGDEGFVFPERRADGAVAAAASSRGVDTDLAICCSGGGCRAAIVALGTLRGLDALGVSQKAAYLCSNSGGSWFNVPFSFQDTVGVAEFLGPVVEPSHLTPDRAKEHEAQSFGHTLSNLFFLEGLLPRLLRGDAEKVVKTVVKEEALDHVRAWSDLIGDNFLGPYGLADHDAAFGIAGGEDPPDYGVALRDVHRNRQDVPFPIACCTTKIPGDTDVFRSFEWTPQYAGSPFPAAAVTDDVRLGGVLMSPYGFNAASAATVDEGTDGKATIESTPSWVVPLPTVAGSSSAFVAQQLKPSESTWGWLGQPALYTVSPDGDELRCQHNLFADGGGDDNLAILPALRRGCRKLVISDANGDAPTDTFDFDIKEYFGRVEDADREGKDDAAVINENAQVFEASAWDTIRDAFVAKCAAGEPCVHACTLKVLPNERQGIAGGYDVHTVWIMNSKQKAFVDSLPAATQKLLADAEQATQKKLAEFVVSDHLKGFPYMSTFDVSPDDVTVGLLGQHATHAVLQAKTELDALLAK